MEVSPKSNDLEFIFITFFRKNALYTKETVCVKYKILNAGKNNFYYLIIKINKYSSNLIYICYYWEQTATCFSLQLGRHNHITRIGAYEAFLWNLVLSDSR